MKSKKIIFVVIISFICTICSADGPLFTNWSFTVKAGIVPSLLTNRGAIYLVNNELTPPVFETACEQTFSDLWDNHPLIVGFDIAYAVADYMEFFGEFDYRRTKPNSSCFTALQQGQEFGTIALHLDSLRMFGGYLGTRYFSCRYLYERMAFFFGLKAGIMHYQEVSVCPFTFTNPANIIFDQNSVWFKASNAVSGGIQIGFDCLLTCSWSLFFNAEVVACSAPKPCFNLVKEDDTVLPALTNILHEQSGTLVAFPINLGFRFYFG